MIEILRDPEALRARCDAARSAGARVFFVPTMGALHEGHMSLLDAASAVDGDCFRVLSVFVNPLQFAPTDDLERYPRDLERDAKLAQDRGADLIFAPSPSEIYPAGFSTRVSVAGITDALEGAHRPGHFEGVATVVTKLFAMVGPCAAAFGQKDYQQWKMIEKLARELSLPVEVIGCPISRERDGLARSSRNIYLSAHERTRALSISRGLFSARAAYEAGERDPRRLERIALAEIEPHLDAIDYVACRDAQTLEDLDTVHGAAALLVAAHLGTTRLIDNLVLH